METKKNEYYIPKIEEFEEGFEYEQYISGSGNYNLYEKGWEEGWVRAKVKSTYKDTIDYNAIFDLHWKTATEKEADETTKKHMRWVFDAMSEVAKQCQEQDSLPSDAVSEKWYDENIDKDCSPSSAIYKFRLWLKEIKASTGQKIDSSITINELQKIKEVATSNGYESEILQKTISEIDKSIERLKTGGK